jgi:hypothetical protein
MRLEQLIGIGLFVVALVLTVYTWRDRMLGYKASRHQEGFSGDILDDSTIAMISDANEPVPTDQDAIEAHQTLLRYIRNDFGKGIHFARDFGTRFFGNNLPFREDLDIRKLMDNYQNPLQRL